MQTRYLMLCLLCFFAICMPTKAHSSNLIGLKMGNVYHREPRLYDRNKQQSRRDDRDRLEYYRKYDNGYREDKPSSDDSPKIILLPEDIDESSEEEVER